MVLNNRVYTNILLVLFLLSYGWLSFAVCANSHLSSSVLEEERDVYTQDQNIESDSLFIRLKNGEVVFLKGELIDKPEKNDSIEQTSTVENNQPVILPIDNELQEVDSNENLPWYKRSRLVNQLFKKIGFDKAKSAVSDSILGTQQVLQDKYSFLYKTFHGEPTNAAGNVTVPITDTVTYLSSQKLAPQVQVFGWHPHWVGDAWKNYNFNLLSIVSYFSYDIIPSTGLPQNPDHIKDWTSTAMIDSAKANGCKVLLTVTNHGFLNNKTFLDNGDAQYALIDSLIQLVAFRDANGIDIDFEAIPRGYEAPFTNFVQRLSNALKKANPKYIVSICIPAKDHNQVFNIKALEPYIDWFVVMGYDYHGAFTKSPGPIAPLPADGKASLKEGLNLASSLADYIEAGASPSKIIMALPYYGGLWRLDEGGAKFIKHLSYTEIRRKYELVYPVQFDSLRTSYYYNILTDSTNYQCWFDNEHSIAKKYDWIKKQKIAGTGMWALGYDSGYIDLWKTIGDKFSTQAYATTVVGFNMAAFIIRYKSLIITSILFFIGFLVLGLVVSLFDWRVRNILFNTEYFRLVYTFICFLLIVLLLQLNWISSKMAILIIGLVLGFMATYSSWRVPKRNLP